MVVIMSPARNNRPADDGVSAATRPALMADAMRLVEALRGYSPWQLESLLEVSAERALTLYDAYAAFDEWAPGSPALLSYYGAAYRAMQPQDFSGEDFAFAQAHLRILSALYGALRPLDGIQPHRLGMEGALRVDGQDLYSFWGDRVYREIAQAGGPIINLASMAYAKMVLPYVPGGDQLVTCRFLKQRPDGTARATVATVRAARGLMVRYILKNRIDRVEGLADFDLDGYRFVPFRSDERTLVFIKE